MNAISPFEPFLEHQGVLILDGGLATELEERGHDLNHPLWSARLLIDNPAEIAAVHRTYLEAGADCIISASYQSSIAGLAAEGLSEKAAKSMIQETVAIACQVRDDFMNTIEDDSRIRPLVAASIGPYGAFLANGAEFRGDYKISKKMLKDFHQPRWELLSQTSADIFACETIPSIDEAEVLRILLDESPEVCAWVSFSCKDGTHISDGTAIKECLSLFEDCPNLLAIGINCTSPAHILSLITQINQYNMSKLIIVYPNSGEHFDNVHKKWIGERSSQDFGKLALEWYTSGARIIGGCCRTGPDHISVIRNALIEFQMSKSKGQM